MNTPSPVNPDLIYALRRVTERAACAAFNWIGRGDAGDGGNAALEAMRSALSEIDLDAVVVIGEATAGEAPQPQRGERLGRPGAAFKADIAVDPVEGTSYLVRGLTNALAVLAVAPRGAMMDPGPAFYMEKFVASAPAAGKIDPSWSTAQKLEELAKVLGKDIFDLNVFVLEKPRHRDLVNEILAAGARVAMYPAATSPARLWRRFPVRRSMRSWGRAERPKASCPPAPCARSAASSWRGSTRSSKRKARPSMTPGSTRRVGTGATSSSRRTMSSFARRALPPGLCSKAWSADERTTKCKR